MEIQGRDLKKRILSDEQIIKLYNEGLSTAEIAEQANVSARYIRIILQKNNIQKRPFGSWKRKYNVYEDYFKTWSNNMAYILGFFVADGMVVSNAQTVSFAQKERYILEDIKKEIKSSHPIIKNEKTSVHILNIGSKVMRNDLIEIHGVMPNKSHQITFTDVPEQYLIHFIRGYFDGDGSINFNKYTVTFVGGSLVFMEMLTQTLSSQGFKPNLVSNNNHYRVHIRGRKSLKLFSKWIYGKKELFLERKYNKFNEEILPLNLLRDRKDVCTRDAVQSRKLNFLLVYSLCQSIENTCGYIGIKRGTHMSWIRNDELYKYNFSKISELMKNEKQ